MLNLNNVTETGTHFIDRNDVTKAPAELITAMPFKLTVTNPRFENVATQDITGADAEGRTILCTRKGWKQGILGVKWDNWEIEYITKKGEPMNVKAMTDAEIEMNLSRLWSEQTARTIKKVMGTIPGPDIAGIVAEEIAKATAKKPEPTPITDMVVVINNAPHPVEKMDIAGIWKKALGNQKPIPEPVEVAFKWAGTEQELDAILAEAVEQDAKAPTIMAPTEAMDWVEQVERRNAHLMECEDCRKEHTAKLNQSLIELNSLIDAQTQPRLLEILKEQRDGIQRELTKFLAM